MKKLNYPKLIKKAIDKNGRLHFIDHLDWEIVKDKGVWTDVFLKLGKNTVFAFGISSSYASRGFMAGSVPETFRDLDDGCWNLYQHTQYITHSDVGRACMKWIQLQGNLPGICLGCNVTFNEEMLGFVFSTKTYPPERINTHTDEIYQIESYVGPLRDIKGGVCS